MDDSRLDEILRRLDAIERRLQDHDHPHEHQSGERYGERHRRCHDDQHGRRRDQERRRDDGQPFDERRVVDLVVRLVAERVEEILWRRDKALEEASSESSDQSSNDRENGSTAG